MSEMSEIRSSVSPSLARKPSAKVVFLGDSGVGKSSVIAYLKSGYTAKRKQPSTLAISSVGEISLEVEEGTVKLDMWDTCGSEQFRTLTNFFFRGAHGAVLVYDVTRKDTLTHLFNGYESNFRDNVPSWLDQFLEHFKQSNLTWDDSDPPQIAVLGNKSDLTSKRKVSEEEARATIDREMKSRQLDYTYFETSALTGENLMEFAKQFASKFPRCCRQRLQGFTIERNQHLPPQNLHPSPKQCRCRATA